MYDLPTNDLLLGLARAIYIRCVYGTFGREITIYMVIYGVYIRFWPTLLIAYILYVTYCPYSVCERLMDAYR